jgi:hypothetical protein
MWFIMRSSASLRRRCAPSLTGIEFSQQFPCLAEQCSNGPSFRDPVLREGAMRPRILISLRRA